MLVPTTILAQQHYGTFAERLKDYPFTIEHVSRFRPRRRAEGRRSRASRRARSTSSSARTACSSRDVRAKDLGLLIVDEEQRFGVKQKELLRQLKLQGRRHLDERDADPAHAADVARRPPRHLGHRDAAGGPPARQDLRRRVRRGARASQALEREQRRARARRSSCTTASRRSTRPPSACAGCAPTLRFEVAHGQMDEGELEAADARVPARRRRRARVRRASSSRASTSRRPTRSSSTAPTRSASPSSTRSAGASAAAASAPTRTCCIPARRR